MPGSTPAARMALISLALMSPALAETMREWNATQREKALTRASFAAYDLPDPGPSRAWSTSRPTMTPEEIEADRRRAEERLAAARERTRELDEHNRRVGAENARLLAEAERAARERREWAAMIQERERLLEARWTSNAEVALRVLARGEPGSEGAVQALAVLRQDEADGSVHAKAALGWTMIHGRHLPLDATKGRGMLALAVGRDRSRVGLVHLATCLDRGIGGGQDAENARMWYRVAVACGAPGHVVARRRLAEMDELGRGAKADLVAAVRWYREAAALGDDRSRLRLAQMQVDGLGMPVDAEAGRALLRELLASDDAEVAAAAEEALR